MAYNLYDFLCADNSNDFAEWTRTLQKPQRAKLNSKIDMLLLHGETLMPHLLTDTHIAGVRKLRVKGNVQLRPLLCRGPQDIETEYTFLMGAKEIGDEWEPRDAPETADARRSVVANNAERRINHERIN